MNYYELVDVCKTLKEFFNMIYKHAYYGFNECSKTSPKISKLNEITVELIRSFCSR